MEMLRIKQLIALPANSIAPDINTGLRGIARLSMILDTLKSLEIDKSGPMKFVEPSHFADPDAAARKLVEIANAVEAVQDGRIYIERINGAFLEAGGSADQFRAALARAIALGWLWRHESGTYVKFTPAGAEMFA
jgi:hypothetical protein